jgi:hypothetical protein
MANDQTAVKMIAPFSRASLAATRSGNSIRASGRTYGAKRLFRRIPAAFPVVWYLLCELRNFGNVSVGVWL